MNDLTVILPVYNERETIKKVIDEWKKMLDDLGITYQLLICEDGSTDGTAQLLLSMIRDYPVILNQKKTRRGYGQAMIDGISFAQSRYILCIDSDGQYLASDFKKIWDKRSVSSVIRGIRVKRKDVYMRKLFSCLFRIWFDFLFSSSMVDPSSSFVLFKKKDIMLYIHYLSFMQEGFWWGFSAVCIRKKISFTDIPIDHSERMFGKTRVYSLKKIFPIAIGNSKNLWQLRGVL